MRFLALLAVISSTSAILFERQSLPSCATTCLATTSTGTCAATNETCLCTDQTFINSALACMKSSCSSTDFQSAEAAAEQLCLNEAGVTLTASSATSTASSATASATSTASHSSGATTGMIPTSINVLAGAVAALAVAAVL